MKRLVFLEGALFSFLVHFPFLRGIIMNIVLNIVLVTIRREKKGGVVLGADDTRKYFASLPICFAFCPYIEAYSLTLFNCYLTTVWNL